MSFWTDNYRKLRNFHIKSSRTRAILLYAFFVVISAIFWWFIKANDRITDSFEIPVVIEKPDSVRFFTPPPQYITVTVTERGSFFLKAMFRRVPPIVIKLSDYSTADDHLLVSQPKLVELVKKSLNLIRSQSISIDETIDIAFAAHSKRVPVKYYVKATAALGYVLVSAEAHDSVTVYASRKTLQNITIADSKDTTCSNLKASTQIEVPITHIKNAIVEPRRVKMDLQVEKLIERTRTVAIELRNAPKGVSMIFLPPTVKIKYWVVESKANLNGTFTVVVDYNTIDSTSRNRRAPLLKGERPGFINNDSVVIEKDSVSYIIEKQL
ncbi:MAG: hypothetical protein IJT30_04580 [Muribaculaceae bacterium]|nr:hypothetical protein [Muribaculaceae bacterium]